MALTTSITLTAVPRTETGKGVARQLRLHGRIPAVVYGRGREPEALSVSLVEFEKAMVGRRGASIIDLDIGGKPVKALIREIQRHPVRPGPLHIDFYEIHEGVALTVDVPIHLIGTPQGVKTHGGLLDQIMREVEIEVLPKDIPDSIDVDVSALEIGDSIHVSDLVVANAEILADAHATVCTVSAPRIEEVEAEAVEEVVEGEAEPELIRRPKEEDEQPAGEEE